MLSDKGKLFKSIIIPNYKFYKKQHLIQILPIYKYTVEIQYLMEIKSSV